MGTTVGAASSRSYPSRGEQSEGCAACWNTMCRLSVDRASGDANARDEPLLQVGPHRGGGRGTRPRIVAATRQPPSLRSGKAARPRVGFAVVHGELADIPNRVGVEL